LFKLCSLLWYHLQRIYETHDIFDSHHHHKPLIISLIKEVGLWSGNYTNVGEFNSNRLSSFLIKLYKEENDLNHLNLGVRILKNDNPNYEKVRVPDAPKNGLLSYSDLTRFFKSKFEENDPVTAWKISALAAIESHLRKNGQAVSYSGLFDKKWLGINFVSSSIYFIN
jgi:hypothetical protein